MLGPDCSRFADVEPILASFFDALHRCGRSTFRCEGHSLVDLRSCATVAEAVVASAPRVLRGLLASGVLKLVREPDVLSPVGRRLGR